MDFVRSLAKTDPVVSYFLQEYDEGRCTLEQSLCNIIVVKHLQTSSQRVTLDILAA